MRPLRFCHLTTFYPPFHFGGDAIGIQRLCQALARRGHHVTVVHDTDAHRMLHGGPAPQPEVDPFGVEVIPLASALGSAACLLTQQTGHPVVHGRRMREILAEGRFDVINYHNVSLAGGPGLWALGSGIKLHMAHEHWLVCESHTLWRHGRELCDLRECTRCVLSYRRPPQLWRRTGMIERYGAHVDAWIAMSEFSREKHREFEFPFPMEVLPYFLPEREAGDAAHRPESPAPGAPARPYFLFVGRLERIKGLQEVIPLFRELPGADLWIAGAGDYAPELQRLASGMPNVRFLGRIPEAELARAYRHALALIVPSLCFETFGIILIEAFQNGIPVIARRLGPFPEIVESSGGGELFADAGELTAALRRMLAEPAHRAALAERGARAFRERWSESAVLPRYLGIARRAALARGRVDLAQALERAAQAWSAPRARTPEPPSSERCAAS
jgi:glycosyltransferase involved in cell wall biosynthesis